ncbi:hypothetical protein [Pseudomonas parafulva]|uniref:hypothetical protein n=1 Tax=Pseudomonas parafulva TaxID=157782 RepID=UPI00054129AA|nr:hypothetical protein [Pseudomonas parafulva]AIZ33542.1 translation initiation factor 2 [Pseudomonas parafulva]
MRQCPLFLLLCCLLSSSPLALAEQPHSTDTDARVSELQQRLQASEQQRAVLSRQLQGIDSTQLERLREENQRLQAAVQKQQASGPLHLLTEQQQWFVIGSGVALLSAVCGILASGGHRRRRQWLN